MSIKNHIWQDGQLLQTNKKWSALKQSQRTWIQEMTAKEHTVFVEEHGKLPMKKKKEVVIDKVHDHINERGIWIPYGEFRSHVAKMIDRLNRKSPLFKLTDKKPKPVKPKPPKVGIEEFPANVQQEVRERFSAQITSYIAQTNRIPTDKTRSGHVKVVLSWFNAKQWKTYEKRMTKNAVLLNIYDEVRNQHK